MVKKIIFIIIIASVVMSCVIQGHKFETNKDGEPILKPESYTTNQKLSEEDFRIIDTSSYYIEIFDIKTTNESERLNPAILKYHKDGYFKRESFNSFGNFDKERKKNSVYYGGKYSISGNKISMESFYPATGSRTKYYARIISNGFINGDRITVVIDRSKHVYVKKTYKEIFGNWENPLNK